MRKAISVLLLGVLFLGTIGYGFMSSLRNSGSNGGKQDSPRNVGGKWEINVNGKTFYLETSPDEAENISVNIYKTISNYAGSSLYISSENDAVFNELYSVLRNYAPRIQKACYGSCPDLDLPEKDCTDNMIVWQGSLENKVYQEENCIFIEGDMRAVDAFLYNLLGFN